MSKKKIYHGVKGERIECNCSNYETNNLKDKISSAFIWAFWIAITLFTCIKCTTDIHF